MRPTLPATPSVASLVWVASALTSLATTAKPRPAGPARAASMLAFKASRLVRLATDLMKSSTEPISSDAAFTDCSVLLSLSTSRVAAAAMVEETLTCSAICPIDLPSSSKEAAMLCTFFEAFKADCETPSAWVLVASAAAPWWPRFLADWRTLSRSCPIPFVRWH